MLSFMGKTSVIITTYESPEWLEKVLEGYRMQSFSDFELLVADDGSGPETAAVIHRFQDRSPFPVYHLWQADQGFRKCQILNKAIMASDTDYLIFSDGDCIPRSDFVYSHMKARESGRFLSGGYCKLNMEASQTLSLDDIRSGRAFDPGFLGTLGLKSSWNAKHCARGPYAAFLNWTTTTSPTWNGHNASGYKKDILAVNGFDERMVYGGQDREFGERLMNIGIRGKQIRYSAICLHLDHKRCYATQEGIRFNKGIRSQTRKLRIACSPFGIAKSAA